MPCIVLTKAGALEARGLDKACAEFGVKDLVYDLQQLPNAEGRPRGTSRCHGNRRWASGIIFAITGILPPFLMCCGVRPDAAGLYHLVDHEPPNSF